MNSYPKKIVSKCVSDPLDEEITLRCCPRCAEPLDRTHHAGTFALPECWVWHCTECEYEEAPE